MAVLIGVGSWEAGIILGILAILSIVGGLVLKSAATDENPHPPTPPTDKEILDRLDRIEKATEDIRKHIESDQRLALLIQGIGKQRD